MCYGQSSEREGERIQLGVREWERRQYGVREGGRTHHQPWAENSMSTDS